MTKTLFACIGILSCLLSAQSRESSPTAQSDPMQLRVNVVLVQLNVAVTDDKGRYVTGLHPQDFSITEDKLPEKISTFEESSVSGKTEMETTLRDQDRRSTGSAVTSEPETPKMPADPADVTISRVT